MELLLQRKEESTEWTHGKLYLNNVYECDTLEDQSQEKKVMHETRIPTGRYKIILRTFGGHHEKYKKYSFHKGMLWLQNVPGFKDILIHIGNTDDDSSGCILVGRRFADGVLQESTVAYSALYPKVLKALENQEEVFITVRNK